MRNLLPPFLFLSALLKIKELVIKIETIQLTESQIKKPIKSNDCYFLVCQRVFRAIYSVSLIKIVMS